MFMKNFHQCNESGGSVGGIRKQIAFLSLVNEDEPLYDIAKNILTKDTHQLALNAQYYNDVIMGGMASQITSIRSVYSTVYSSSDQRKHQSSASLAFVRWPVTDEFPAQMASNAE